MNKKIVAGVGIVVLLILIGLAIWFFAPSKDLSPTGAAVADFPVMQDEPEPTFFEPQAQEHRIEILGKDGYDVSELNIRKDDTVIWVNKDPSGKRNVITIKRLDGIDALYAGKLFFPDEEWSYVFTEAGEYQFWTEAYGIRGSITVEE